ncbi:MAG: hypothetical protein AAGI88_21120 [Pseudomonadota bacterium]
MSRIFFTDRDLGKRFPILLKRAGIAVERHADLFAPDGSDEQWLEYCGANGRIALSHNLRIRYTPNEIEAVRRHEVPLIILIGKAPLPDLAENFLRTRERIEAFIEQHQPPWIAKLYRPSGSAITRSSARSGRIDLWTT